MAPRAEIALLTDRRYTATVAPAGDWYLGNILADDRLLIADLAARGLASVRLDWADEQIDWGAFRAVVFRTTWDYYDRQKEFTAWLDRVEPMARLINDAATVRWNLDKHYLADLAARGVPVVPTRFLERGTTASAALDAFEAALRPFEPDIVTHGEDTLVLVGGRFTHALTKRAKPGDFRVQDDHGGTVHPCTPTATQISLAEAAMAACENPPAYGRVDLVRRADGAWAVMELELIEPELWLRRHPAAAAALAEAIVGRLA